MTEKKPIKLNDEQLMLDASQVADIYHQLTLELFDQVIDRIKERGSASLDDNPYIWQLEKMNEMGLLNEDNLKLISDRSGIAEEQLRHVIQNEGYKIYKDTKQQLLEATGGTGTGASSLIQNNLAAYVNQTMNDIDNLINTTLPKSVIGAYKSIIEEATAKVVTGLTTSDKAISDTVMKWAKKGFYGFTDSQGKHWKADTYARQVIKSTAWRVYREVRMAPAEELGIDTFYYHKKATAREMCAPLQHQIVTTGVARTEKGERILALSDYGYGYAGGCQGINCTHEMTPYIPGVNYKPDLPDELKDLTPEEAIANANVQAKQRALERSIRQSKEFLHVAEKLGDSELIDKYKSKVRIQQGAMRDYLKQHPFLHRDYARERYYYNDDAVQKLYKTIDKRSKKEYSEILRNLGSKAPKSYSDFQALSRSEKDSLRYDNRIVNYFKGDIQEKLSDKQKQQAVEAYFNFKNDGIVFGDHAIARYIERMRRNDGTFTYNYDTVKTVFSLPPNYVSEQNGRLARYYNGILYITEPDTDIVVTMMKRKKLKGFKPL
ncbi:phage minor capsid protein [Streptococcus gordonii]|uniref:phage minor capsid protein n=1 Tax=Streptococcus gordonii TaxID=1302 RepID=UPI000779818B|nr:phage minor capsid protein [Streptococcus gordonii]QBX16342.1 minor capsid protein [Streptococcus phage Javan247]HEP5937573.1 phage minor capsid protein [Streptococcus pyogenes]HEQ4682280.1 phage minor capsid protein [Streptococcus pyogenes]